MQFIKGHFAENQFTSWLGTILALTVSLAGLLFSILSMSSGDIPRVSLVSAFLCITSAFVVTTHKAFSGRFTLVSTIAGLSIAITDIINAYGFSIWHALLGEGIADLIAPPTSASLTAATASCCVFILFLRRNYFPKTVVSSEILMTGLMIIAVALGNFMAQLTSYIYIDPDSFNIDINTTIAVFFIIGADLVVGGQRYLKTKHSTITFKRLVLTSYTLLVIVISLFLVLHGASLKKSAAAIDSVTRIATSIVAQDMSEIRDHLYSELAAIKNEQRQGVDAQPKTINSFEIRTSSPANPEPLTYIFSNSIHFYSKSVSPTDDFYIAMSSNNQFTLALRSQLSRNEYVWLFSVYQADSVLDFFKAEIPSSLLLKIEQDNTQDSPLTFQNVGASFHVLLKSNGFATELNSSEMSLLVFMLAIIHSIMMSIDSRAKQLSLKQYLKKIFDLMDAGLATIDDSGKILSCNNAFRTIIGIDKNSKLDEVQAQGLSNHRMESKFYTTNVDGQQRHYQISKHRTHSQGQSVNIVVLHDKTSDLLIQRELNDRNNEFENILGSLSESVITFDHLLQATFVNNAAKQLLNIHPEDDWQNTVTQIFLTAGQPTLTAIHKAIETRTSQRFDSLTLALPDGPSITVSLTIAPITTTSAPPRAVLMFKDATEETKARRAQADALLTLENMNQDLSEFNHLVSHDFKEPSRTVSLLVDAVELSLSQGDIDGAAVLLQKIKSAAVRLHGYTVSLKEFSEAKQLEASNVPVDLRGAIHHAISDLQARIEQCKAVIEVDPDLPTVLGNADFIARVFMNLINNAIKYVPTGKTPYVRIWAKENMQGQTSIFIKDNGIGIDKEDFEIIFLPFRRLHSSGDYHGSGVGLAIVERLVKKMFGSISVKSSSQSGTVFELVLHVV